MGLESNIIYNMDCLEGMKLIADASVDMILCDLPYGTTQNKWDSVLPLDKLWQEYKRLCTGTVVLTAAQPFTSALVMSNVKEFRYSWVWEKSSVTGHLNAHKRPMRMHEDILVFGNAPYYPQNLQPYRAASRRGGNGSNFGKSGTSNWQEWTNYPRSIIRFEREGKAIHPTQKPVALAEYFIKTYTNPGDTVLDNCMGSGTTAIACLNTGRNYIGFENDDKYYEVAVKRVAAHSKSLSGESA